MTLLYPRLDANTAFEIWENQKDLDIPELYETVAYTHPAQYYASTGGTEIPSEALREIGKNIRAIAEDCGYPENRGQAALSKFDHKAAVWLHENLAIIDGEALRYEPWAFLALCVVPDVVKWRFEAYHQSRLLGGRRNCFQRLWLRARAFDLGPDAKERWGLLRVMTEDAFVSVIERPSLAGNSKICRAIGIAWFETSRQAGKPKMEEINREAIRQLRALSVLYLLDDMNWKQLRHMVAECYQGAVMKGSD